MASLIAQGLKLDLYLTRGADYQFVVRWATALGGLTGWTGWACEVTCHGAPNIVIPVDAAPQSAGFVLLNFDGAALRACRARESWGLEVDDPNGRSCPMINGGVHLPLLEVPV